MTPPKETNKAPITDPKEMENLWTFRQRIQNNPFEKVEWTTRKHS